jgi:3-hydroxybutyryl-CoA dehydratase
MDERTDVGKTFDEIAVGETASVAHTITARDIDLYAELTHDYNPLHMDEAYATGTVFGGRIAHGTITLGLIAPVIGMKLPGKGCVLTSISSEFLRPVRIGDTVTALARVESKDADRRIVTLALTFTNQRQETVATGSAKASPKKR